METKLELTEQNYRYLFENATDAMWIHDLKGSIVGANRAVERLTGYSRQELLGMDIRKFIANEDGVKLARELRRKLLAGEDVAQPYEQLLRRKDGTVRIVNMATSPVTIGGSIMGFQHVARDITEERQLRENMAFYIQQIIRAQEDERKRLSRELHDESSPPLLLLIQRIDKLASAAKSRSSQPVKQGLEELRVLAVEALEGLRRCAQDLRPRILDDLGLLPALDWMAENLVKGFHIEATVKVTGHQRSLPAEVELLLFRIAQEALANVRRHAGATRAAIMVNFSDDIITLTVQDNGKGFELPHRLGDLAGTGKLGLAGMQERARLIRGKLTIESAVGRGTAVSVEVPLEKM